MLTLMGLFLASVSSFALEIGTKPHCRGDGDELHLAILLDGQHQGKKYQRWFSLGCLRKDKYCMGASLDTALPLSTLNPATENGIWKLVKAEPRRSYLLRASSGAELDVDLRHKQVTLKRGKGNPPALLATGYCPKGG